MKSDVSPCDEERIALFLSDDLSPPHRLAFEQHLDECLRCRTALDQLAATAADWDEARTFLSGWDERPVTGDDVSRAARYRTLLGPTDDPRMLGRIGLYEVVGILGSGGMGVVFKACDTTLNRYVAIKMLSPPDSESGIARQRFLREAQSAAAVIHDNVVAIHSIDHWQGAPYIVMTYVKGESLRRRLERRGALSLREVLRIGMQVAAGLAAAHAQGLVHRDIKPANILLETDVDRVKITDFGIARAIDDGQFTMSGTLVGTPQSMSPEQACDQLLDYRTDLFSLGSTLYEACTGRSPFQASTSYAVLRKVVEHTPVPLRQLNPDVPVWLEAIITRLLMKRPDQRYASAAEVEALFKQCLAHVEQPLSVALPAGLSPSNVSRGSFSIQLRRCFMTLATISLLSFSGWILLAQLGQNGGQLQEVAKSPDKERVVTTKVDDSPTSAAQDYKISVVGVADVSSMPMTTEFDISRLKVQSQANTLEASVNNGFAQISSSGFAAVSGGGFAGSFHKPNLGIALKVEPVKPNADQLIELGGKVRAVDEHGEVLEGSDTGPAIHHFAQFEKTFPGTHALYLYLPSRDTKTLASLEGELLVGPGKVTAVTFEPRKQTKQIGKVVIVLESVNIGKEGIQIAVTFPPIKAAKEANTPQERFQATVNNRGLYSATVEDDLGEMHPAVGATNVVGATKVGGTTSVGGTDAGGTDIGGGETTAFSISSKSVQGSLKSRDNSVQTFNFGPLPPERSVKAIHVKMRERLGEPKIVKFELENVSWNQEQK